MDAILDDLEAIARRCERVAKKFEVEPLAPMTVRLITPATNLRTEPPGQTSRDSNSSIGPSVELGCRGNIDASREVGRSSSQSWLGYQSTIYLAGFKPALGGECFDSEWGELGGICSRTRGEWVYTEYDDVKNEIQRRAGVFDLTPLDEAAESAEVVFNRSRSELMPLIDALIATIDDPVLREAKTKLSKLTSHSSPQYFVDYLRPNRNFINDPTNG